VIRDDTVIVLMPADTSDMTITDACRHYRYWWYTVMIWYHYWYMISTVPSDTDTVLLMMIHCHLRPTHPTGGRPSPHHTAGPAAMAGCNDHPPGLQPHIQPAELAATWPSPSPSPSRSQPTSLAATAAWPLPTGGQPAASWLLWLAAWPAITAKQPAGQLAAAASQQLAAGQRWQPQAMCVCIINTNIQYSINDNVM